METWDLSLSPLSRLYCCDNIVITPIVIVATMLQQSQVYAYTPWTNYPELLLHSALKSEKSAIWVKHTVYLKGLVF